MPARACVSTSSVTNTFVTPSKLIKAFGSFAMNCSLSLYAPYTHRLVQTDAVISILCRHIRQYYLIAHLQAGDHFNRIHRTDAQRHRDAGRFFSIRIQLEQGDLGAGLADYRPAYVDYIRQTLDGNRAVHAEVGTHTVRMSLQFDVDIHCSVGRSRVDSCHMARNNSVSSVDGGHLTDCNVLGLGFRNLQRGLQPVGLGDLRQNGAGLDAHTLFERQRSGS